MNRSFRNMCVLHVTPTFYPATFYGGPIWSTYALCNALASDSRISLSVLTTDAAGPALSQRVAFSEFPIRYEPGYDVFFTRRILGQEIAPGLVARLWRMIGAADVVHLTGTYSFPTIPTLAICRLRGKPVLWSPRGALLASENWGSATRQRAKHLWERSCRMVMPTRTTLHVTSEAERLASCARMPGLKSVVIPNGVEVPPEVRPPLPRTDGVLRVMFLGRIDPVKGVDKLIRAVGQLPRGHVRLDLYGEGETAYVRTLAALAAKIGIDGDVRFHGHVEGQAKLTAFANADLSVLPSHTENFGMAVAEALAHGVPVIAGKGVPWSEVEERGCGRWVENSPDALAGAIADMGRRDLAAMGLIGRRWMHDEFDWRQVGARVSEAYASLCDAISPVSHVDASALPKEEA